MADTNKQIIITDDDVSELDKAIAAAKERKAKRQAAASGEAPTAEATVEKPAKAKKEKAPKKEKASSEDREAKKAELEKQRAERKAAREVKRAAKKAEREATKRTPHMTKVEKAAGKLPQLNDEAKKILGEVTTNFSRDQVTAIALHLQHFNRVKATERAINQKIEVGDQVRILGGESKYTGMTGEVVKARRIRCFVKVAGVKKEVYCFTSDVEKLAGEVEKTGTDN